MDSDSDSDSSVRSSSTAAFRSTLYCYALDILSLRIGCISVATRVRLLGPTGAYWGLLEPAGACWGLLGPTVISVSIRLPVSSVLSACCCLDRHCVPKSLVMFGYDRIIRQLLPTILCICIPVCCAQQSCPAMSTECEGVFSSTKKLLTPRKIGLRRTLSRPVSA